MLEKFLPPRKPRAPRPAASVRLIPAVIATGVAVLGLKAVALAEDIAEAPAADAAHAEHAEATSAPAEGAAANQCAPPSFAEQAGLSPSEVQVLQALGARREALDSRASQLGTQDALMTAAEQRLDQRLAELHQLESTVNQLLGQLDEAQAQRVANLVDVYQRMRAKDAAAVFDGLDDGVLVQVASRMRQANLAEVMGNMDPTRARRLTVMLAELSRPPSNGEDLLQRTGLPPMPQNIPAPPARPAAQ